jgi:hypothetical protein
MTLRRTAGLLAVTGLLVGLLGSGVGATFIDSLTATENINVGNFSCYISDATDGATFGTFDGGGNPHSVTYNAPTIMSSAAGSAPFNFTVKNGGSFAMNLHVTAALTWTTDTAFGSMPVYDQVINPTEEWEYQEGLTWPTLSNQDLGDSASVTYTVSCNDVTDLTVFGPASTTESPIGTFNITSSGTTYSSYGTSPDWGGIAVPAHSGDAVGDVSLSFDQTGGTATVPRWSIPISTDGSTFSGMYAFISESDCTPSSPVGTNTNCGVYFGPDHFANWAAFVSAHGAYAVPAGYVPLIVVDGTNGTFTVSNITY